MNIKIFKKYPAGFGSLFATQACFNIGFYGLKSIFILYVIKQYGLAESEAFSIFAAWMALSYGASIIGGWIADNSLGTKPTIILGSILQTLGIFLLMSHTQEFFYAALASISLGSGLIKPTLSTSVGMLFKDPKDPAKDKAYSTFYIAMNIGGLIAPLVCGVINNYYEMYYNNLLLITIIAVGACFFYRGTNFKQEKSFSNPIYITLLLAALFGTFYLLFKYQNSFNHLMGIVAIGSLLYFSKIFVQSSLQERRDLLGIVFYILSFVLFCALFEQESSSLMLFFDKAVDRNLMGFVIPPAFLLALGPVFVLICSPILILLFERVIEKKQPLNGLTKLSFGFAFLGLSFLVISLSCYAGASMFWIVLAILMQTIGELLIVPIGFANISKLAPPHLRTRMMSFWLMAIAYGNYCGGFIAKLSINHAPTLESSLSHYRSFFFNLAIMPCCIALMLFIYYYVKSKRFSKPSSPYPV